MCRKREPRRFFQTFPFPTYSRISIRKEFLFLYSCFLFHNLWLECRITFNFINKEVFTFVVFITISWFQPINYLYTVPTTI